ncbi:protein PHLOEM PROTEIN 2-LIKE A1-like [Iris pallida]|uniref:Protein PHLOEM PROTEIN 2-LIKE A1-like n=1 Tax=Iris pallida TaxID=29817 RepID=A0AAX6FIE5_IRIPA|nr:protein PHLOEM PROTEIN 2-LIKE A1-like [Iris pallida]
MLFARDLQITWSEDQKYWQWVCLKETSDMEIEAASLLNVCWLEIHGRFDTSLLSPGATYDVSFVVMMELGYGWATPVNLRLVLPDGSVQQRRESLLDRPGGQWIELKAGELAARKDQAGQMEFSLYEYEGGQWKRGLIVKGVLVRPKK